MKLFITAAAFAAALSSAALAQTYYGAASGTPGGLSASARNHVLQLVPGADLSGLSKTQVQTIEAFFVNSANLRSDNNPSGKIKLILSRG
jgi:hypothetical protein